MTKELKDKLYEIIFKNVFRSDKRYAAEEAIIEEVIIPLVKEAYREGYDFCSQEHGGIDFTEFGDLEALSIEEFIQQKFGLNNQ